MSLIRIRKLAKDDAYVELTLPVAYRELKKLGVNVTIEDRIEFKKGLPIDDLITVYNYLAH